MMTLMTTMRSLFGLSALSILLLSSCTGSPIKAVIPVATIPPIDDSQNNGLTLCDDISVSPIAISAKAISAGGTAKLSITVDNPNGRLINYNWQTLFGTIYPNVGVIASQTTYTAPNVPTNDVIKLAVNIQGCETITRNTQILVIANETSSNSRPQTSPSEIALQPTSSLSISNKRSSRGRLLRVTCSDGEARILSPVNGEQVKGKVLFQGTATCSIADDLKYYKLELVGNSCGTAGCFLCEGREPVTGGLLCDYDVSKVPNGLYSVRLTVVGKDSEVNAILPNHPEVQITVAN